MDVSDIIKAANVKALSENAEKLGEKISRENRNIIKLKIAQDTAYWDLKEQLCQVEENHEKLQANMVDVQMQHEATSGQYQEELRHRHETLNKLGSTREICNVLEGYTERLQDTLTRCQADQKKLYEVYQKSAQVVREMKNKQIQAVETNRQHIENLKEKLKMTTDHYTQLLEQLSAEKQKSEAAFVGVNTELSAALAKRHELAGKLDQCRHELEKKEESVDSLKKNIQQLFQEFSAEATQMRNTLLKQDKELKESNSAIESLKQALANQEHFTQDVTEQKNQLQEKVAALEDGLFASGNAVKELKRELERAFEQNDKLKTEVGTANEKFQSLEKEITGKNQLLTHAQTEIDKFKQKLTSLEAEKQQVSDDLTRAKDDSKGLAVKIQELTAAGEQMNVKIAHIEMLLDECREKADKKLQELRSTIESKDRELESKDEELKLKDGELKLKERELDSKASAIGQLMSEVKASSDVKARLETAIERMSEEIDKEREAICERERNMEKQIEILKCSVRNKDQELSIKLNTILELRGDKARAEDKIQDLRNKIDNVQKELTGASENNSIRRDRVQPEQDDNAVMLTPAHKKTNPRPSTQPNFAPPQIDPAEFDFLSDGSMDADKTVDATEVKRRFELLSRGGRLSPTPAVALKRRRGAAGAGAGPSAAPAQGIQNRPKAKERTFFKTKRQENNPKKFKPTTRF